MLTDPMRRRFAPLLLLAAGLGAYAMVDRELPHDHDAAYDLGHAASDVTDLEVTWVRIKAGPEQAELTTRWHFAKGTAPARVETHVRLPDGEWEVSATVERYGKGTTRWSGRVNLERTPWWKRDNLSEVHVTLPVRDALR